MTRSSRAMLIMMSAALGAGCSQGADPVLALEGLPVPAGLTVRGGSGLDDLDMSWQLACLDCGYEFQYTVAGQTQLVAGGPLPPGTIWAHFSFSADTPELLHFQFQIRSVRGTEASGWSAPVEYQRGIRPPTISLGSYSVVTGQRISWSNASLVADHLVVEREAPPGHVAILTSTLGATSLDDVTFTEEALNVYRVRYGAGAVWSKDAEVSVTLPIRQPVDGRATVGPEGVTLSWTNRSVVAEQIAVACSDHTLPGPLPATSTSYLDPTFPPWPDQVFQVRASRLMTPVHVLMSDLPTIELPPFRIEGGLVTLDARRSPHPGFAPSPSGDGAWYRLSYQPSAGPTVERLDDAGTTSFVLHGDRFLRSDPVFDGAGHPHVYTVVTGGTGLVSSLGHGWHDGTTWHQEVTSPPGPSSPFWFLPGVDGDGVSHVLYMAMSGELVHGLGTANGWAWTSLSEFGDLSGSLVVTADGWAHFAKPARIGSRPPGGIWTFEVSPTTAWQVAAEAGGDLAIFGRSSEVGTAGDVVYVERRAGAWGPVELVATSRIGAMLPSAARSPDGSRVFMGISVPDDVAESRLDLFGRVDGVWQAMRLGPSQDTVKLSFTSSGKLRGTTRGASWTEP